MRALGLRCLREKVESGKLKLFGEEKLKVES
jgi:hypothetical protein